MNTLALINFDLIKRTEDLVGVVVWPRIRSLFQGASSTRLRLLLLLVLLLLLLLLLLLVNLLTSRWRVAPFAVWRRSWQPEAAEWKSSKLSTAVPQKSSSLSLSAAPSSSAAASFSLLWHSSSGKSFLPIYVALTSQHRRRCAHHQHIPLSSSCAQL